MIRLRHFASALTFLLLSGCVTTVDVVKVSEHPDAHGLRYSLPAVFLLVQPQADGTATYNWVYLPDPDKTYAIEQHAYLAKFTLDASIANGLLSKINTQSDTTAVASKLFDVAQSTFAAREQANSAAAKTAATNLTTAKNAVTAAKLSLDQAEAERQIIDADANATDAQKLSAQLKVKDAEIAYHRAEQAYRALANGSGDVPATGPQLSTQYGPVLFRVVQDKDSVQLVAVNTQTTFDTVTAASAPSSQTIATYSLKLPKTTYSVNDKPVMLSISVEPAVYGVNTTQSILTANSLPVTTPSTYTLSDDKKTLMVVFANGLAAGTYVLTPAIIIKQNDKPVATQSVNFSVQ
ncbi:MAG TPA: hypothetical protein VII23_06350 [Terriglobales bacterium]